MKIKLSQYDSPVLTTPIKNEDLVKKVWDKFLAEKHSKLITLIKNAISLPAYAKLKEALLKQFPLAEDYWKQFAYSPLDLTFEQLKKGMDRLTRVPELSLVAGAKNALDLYLNQYRLITEYLKKLPQKDTQIKQQQDEDAAKPPSPRPQNTKRMPRKIKTQDIMKLQSLLKVNPTGKWNNDSNAAFLRWLYANGWQNYIVNGKFVGSIDDAINALMMERADTNEQNK